MPVSITIVSGRSDLRRFVRFPFSLYAGTPQWVPPIVRYEIDSLREDCNPAFEHCRSQYWLAWKDGRVAGRVAGIINTRANEKWSTHDARFGWLDFRDDPEVSSALLDTVEQWATENGQKRVVGPMGFTGMDAEGMLVEGFQESGTMTELYNHAYYPAHVESLGYRKETDWVEYEVQTPDSIPEKALRVGKLVLKRSGLQLVAASKATDLLQYADQVFALLNNAYQHLYGSVELTERQIAAYKQRYFRYIDPRFNKVVVDGNDQVVAFGLVFPGLADALRKANGRLLPFGFIHVRRAIANPRDLVLGLIAVTPEHQGGGVPAILFSEITQAAIECGIRSAETGRELEDNIQMRSLWKTYPARQHKRRRVYFKELQASPA